MQASVNVLLQYHENLRQALRMNGHLDKTPAPTWFKNLSIEDARFQREETQLHQRV